MTRRKLFACVRISIVFVLLVTVLHVYHNSQRLWGNNGSPPHKQDRPDSPQSANIHQKLSVNPSTSAISLAAISTMKESTYQLWGNNGSPPHKQDNPDSPQSADIHQKLSVNQSTSAISLAAISTTNETKSFLHESWSVGINGLLNVSNNSCCLKSAEKSLEELCSVDFSNTLFDLFQTDPKSKLKLKNIAVSMENGQTSVDGCTCEDYMYCKFVVVTGISSNYFQKARPMISSVQKHLPSTRLIVYDLGLTEQQRKEVRNYCNIELRKFNFSQYPNHVSNLITYAFKPLIIMEVAQQYEVVLWVDASIRVKAHLPDYLLGFLRKFPYVPGPGSGFPSISLTHDGMLEYLNITRSRNELNSHKNEFPGTAFLLWVNTFLKQNFLRYWIDCAIHPECISPPGARVFGCKMDKIKDGAFIGCHRFDQSALNMILLREFGIGIKILYHSKLNKVWTIERQSTAGIRPTICN